MPNSNQVKCHDCEAIYGDPGWADVTVPKEVWAEISPTNDDGGILCFRCMNIRLGKAGYGMDGSRGYVPSAIRSGPMAQRCFDGVPNEELAAIEVLGGGELA